MFGCSIVVKIFKIGGFGRVFGWFFYICGVWYGIGLVDGMGVWCEVCGSEWLEGNELWCEEGDEVVVRGIEYKLL